MSRERLKKILAVLSIVLIANGVTIALAEGYWSAPKITIITSGPGQPVTFRIHFYLLRYSGTYNSWTLIGPSTLNPNLWKIELPNGIYPAPAVRVWDPDGVEYQWVGPVIVVQKPGVNPGNPGADEGYYVDIVFDPNDQDGWSKKPDTSKTGWYRVDFDGRIFLSDGKEEPFMWTRYFDIEHRFYVPELPALSLALVFSGLTMLFFRKRLAK
ncbi:hypothetical protein KEJ51_05460 [Candidatus Bathyarchaeota archaeon]|nr:hypothetical protein [Candidatus Bathyarchaeota archaeon]